MLLVDVELGPPGLESACRDAGLMFPHVGEDLVMLLAKLGEEELFIR